MTQLSHRTWYHYCPSGTIIETDVCYDLDYIPDGLWLSSSGEPASWDTWRKKVDPRDEPLAEDLKKLFAIKLRDTARIYIADVDETLDETKLFEDYDGVYIPSGGKSFEGSRYSFERLCLWNTDTESTIASIEEIPSPLLQQTS